MNEDKKGERRGNYRETEIEKSKKAKKG